MTKGSQWTDNFNESEFTVSRAHPDLVEPIPFKYKASMRQVAEEILQPIRSRIGRSIEVLSGYRSPVLNSAVNGSRTSQHVVGEAADFTTTELREVVYTMIDMVEGGELLSLGQFIYYPDQGFIHVALVSRRYPHATLCIKWPDYDLNYTPCMMTREAFDEMVPPHLDPNYV